ncbi:hypothetical protein SAMN05444354_1226 [Stigmatella aurantiaca]|uniref:Uncharacterized protein n=1 Tax=Stigmatella aurantiaca TaxID=41 RepID=A0A1H8ASB7_STIAU|nr:hypothetical protein [Stigmatella aurantiaca]SEM72854.1 hypothetical protein SAMN05444354_1226 [Stigmatella aurantiaca]
MRETLEVRVDEELARKFLEPGLGVPLGKTLRRVVLPTTDARLQQIQEIQREQQAKGKSFFIYWEIRRRYSGKELQAAELLRLMIQSGFEPPGAMCGTQYDESSECPACGAGALQKSELILNTRHVPKGKDIARTIAGEIVVSPRLVRALEQQGIRGAEYRPVMHKGRYGLEPSEWKQLIIQSQPLLLSSKTLAGKGPFDLDEEGEYRCPRGHIAGLGLLSELYVQRSSVEESDWFRTDKGFGVRRGELRPEPKVLISQKLRQVLVDLKAKGFGLEVAHLT